MGQILRKKGLQKDRHFFVEKTTAHYLNHFASLRWLQRPVWTISFPKTIKNQTRTPLHKCFHLHASCGCSVNIYTKDLFLFFNCFKFYLHRVQPCRFTRSLPMKSRKRSAHDIFATRWPCSWHHHCRLLGAKRQHSLWLFPILSNIDL